MEEENNAIEEINSELDSELVTVAAQVAEKVRYWEPELKLSPQEEMAGRAAIAAKIAQVYSLVGVLPERGWNDHFKYSYVLAGDLYNAVRSALAQAHLALVPLLGVQIEEWRAGKYASQRYLVQQWRMVLVDAETGYSLAVPWVSEAQDNEDKGTSKLATSGMKYFCKTFFMIPTGDDLDVDAASGAAEGLEAGSGRNGPSQPVNRRGAQRGPKEQPKAAAADPQVAEPDPAKVRLDKIYAALRAMDSAVFVAGSKANAALVAFKVASRGRGARWDDELEAAIASKTLSLDWLAGGSAPELPKSLKVTYDKIVAEMAEDPVGVLALTGLARARGYAELVPGALLGAVKSDAQVHDYSGFSSWLESLPEAV